MPPNPASMTIFVEGLRMEAQIGVHAYERGGRQPLIIDVELDIAMPEDDILESTFDYQDVVAAAQAVIDAGHIHLVEQVAKRIAGALLDDPRVKSTRVRVAKPRAIPTASAAGAIWSSSR